MGDRFIKYFPNEKAFSLRKHNLYAFVLLCVVAERAKRYRCDIENLDPGEAYIGDFENYGMSRQNYRTALDFLIDKKILEKTETCKKPKKSTTKSTTKGTKVKLIDSTIYDINIDNHNHLANHLVTTYQPPSNHEQELYNCRSEEQQQQEEKFVAVFSCLENLNDPSIAKEDKINITQKYKDQEQIVVDAVAVVTAVDFVPDVTLLKSLYAACKGAWKPKESKTQWLAINKAKALELEKKGHEFYSILTGPNYLEIVMGMVSKLVQFEQHPEKFDKEVKFHLKQELKNNA